MDLTCGPEVMEIVNEENLPDTSPADRGRKCWARLRKVKGSAPLRAEIKRPPQLTASFISDDGIPDGVGTKIQLFFDLQIAPRFYFHR
jgi:hypothetical protein